MAGADEKRCRGRVPRVWLVISFASHDSLERERAAEIVMETLDKSYAGVFRR